MASLSVLHILRTIKERGAASRTELQQRTGLSWGTITNTTRELLQRNLIREEGALKTRAGRKPMRLTINPESHGVVGVDLAPGRVGVVTLNLAGETLWSGERGYAMSARPEEVLEMAAELIGEATGEKVMGQRVCLGVGVAAQGALDVGAGVMRFAPRMPGWNGVGIREYLQGRTGVTVILEHDPNCLALAERWFGAASAAEDVLCILLGEGVGMGILLHGEVYRGSQQMAGEFGHMTVEAEGLACACGDFGCIESYCSTGAVTEGAGRKGASVAEVVAAARAGDGTALGAFARMGKYLGIGVANLVDLFNPSLIVLCGPLTEGRAFFMPALEERLGRHAWRHSSREVVISTLGERAVAVGACGAVLQGMFDGEEGGEAVVAEEIGQGEVSLG